MTTVTEADILAAAKQLIEQFGDGAAHYALRQADDLEVMRFFEGAEAYKRIVAAIVELRTKQ